MLLVACSVWLAENQDVFIWRGERLWIVQAIILLAELISLLLLKWGLQILLAPFTVHSAEVGAVHKFFNRVVLWPEPDPLRMRRTRERSESPEFDASSDASPWLTRRTAYALAVVACLFLIAGGLAVMQLATDWPVGQPNMAQLLAHPSVTRARVEQRLSQDTLPEEFFGMQLVRFDEFATPGTGTGIPITARWTFANDVQTVELLASAPYRGSIAMERQRLLDGSLIVKPLQSFELQPKETDDTKLDIADDNSDQAQSSHAFRVDELTLKDPLVGRSYIAYTNWAIDGSSREVEPLVSNSAWRQLFAAIRYQPTSANLSLCLEGETPTSDDAKENLHQMFARAAELVRQALAAD